MRSHFQRKLLLLLLSDKPRLNDFDQTYRHDYGYYSKYLFISYTPSLSTICCRQICCAGCWKELLVEIIYFVN